MLVAQARKTVGAARLSVSLVFARGAMLSIIDRAGLLLDARFVPPAKAEPRGGACIYLVDRGSFVLDGELGPSFVGPVAITLSEQHLEGALGVRSTTFRNAGSPSFAAIELHVAEGDAPLADTERPRRLELDDTCWEVVARVIAL